MGIARKGGGFNPCPKFHIGLPKVHRQFCMDPPKWYIVSVWSHLRFSPQSSHTRFPESGKSGVSQLLCKKSYKTSYLKQNHTYGSNPNWRFKIKQVSIIYCGLKQHICIFGPRKLLNISPKIKKRARICVLKGPLNFLGVAVRTIQFPG